MGNLQALRAKILAAPDEPGVYLMRDNRGVVLYVGKANSLKKRLRSYLGPDLTPKTAALMAKVSDIELKLTANEALALFTESSLICNLKPKYNISLRDDKSFPWVRISGEEFPTIYVTRKKDDSRAQYLGPYTNALLLKSALKIIRRKFAFRSCQSLPKKSCLYHKISLCPAPCIGKITAQDYARTIESIVLILKGQTDRLIHNLTKAMQVSAKALNFEMAQRLRDQVAVLAQVSGSTGVANLQEELEDLKFRLGLKKIPERIEGFDVSNISGKLAVGSMVSFYQGVADKNNYRRFRIKSFSGIDDYKMLSEIVLRRYRRLVQEGKVLPDLILIDGGRGHLLTAQRQLQTLKLDIPLVSIAKERENIYSNKKIFTPSLFKNTLALNLMRRVRDEAHRFAIGYHRFLRSKELVH